MLVRKKILMQIRDKKTLGIDTVFPIVLIILGLWLATLAIFKDGAPRTVSPPALYPETTIYYNEQSASFIKAKIDPAILKEFV